MEPVTPEQYKELVEAILLKLPERQPDDYFYHADVYHVNLADVLLALGGKLQEMSMMKTELFLLVLLRGTSRFISWDLNKVCLQDQCPRTKDLLYKVFRGKE